MKYLIYLFLIICSTSCVNKSNDNSTDINNSKCLGPKPAQPCITTYEYNPVCGCDGKTYPNPGSAACAGVLKYEKGPCSNDQANQMPSVPMSPTYEVLTVEDVQYGKDGYGATLTNSKGAKFKTTISIPNLGDHYLDMKVGEKVIIEGEYQESDPTFIIAKKIIKQ